MTNDEIFLIWAPDESPWSRWAKPVLFAYLDPTPVAIPVVEMAGEFTWVPSPGEKTAMVLDLPGADGVWTGIALAARGYRPVPLYNALPQPYVGPSSAPSYGGALAAVNVPPILDALRAGAEPLARLSLPSDATPVFLLDADRAGDGRKMKPNEFDNRSISFTTDFPSANFFAAQGIERVILVQRDRLDARPDIAHSLRRWQEAGFVLQRKQLNSPEPPMLFEVPKPLWFGAMFQRALASVGLRRSGSGGFGAWIPDSSAGG